MRIRAARAGDLEAIRGIEARAGTLFYDVGMPDIAGHPVPAVSVLARFVRAGRSWVVVEGFTGETTADAAAASARDAAALGHGAAGSGFGAARSAGAGASTADLDGGLLDGGAVAVPLDERAVRSRLGGAGAGLSVGDAAVSVERPDAGTARPPFALPGPAAGLGATDLASAGPEAELAGGVPIAYVLVEVVDGLAHIEQVSVDPPYARRGIGRRLIDHVGRWAGERGMSGLTLTTFRGVPWNAPYYARLGFVELAEDERGPELARLMAVEARHGLDPVERIAMRRDVVPTN